MVMLAWFVAMSRMDCGIILAHHLFLTGKKDSHEGLVAFY